MQGLSLRDCVNAITCGAYVWEVRYSWEKEKTELEDGIGRRSVKGLELHSQHWRLSRQLSEIGFRGQQKMLHAVQRIQWVGMPLVCRQLIHENRRKVEDLTAGGKPCFLNNTGDVNLKSFKSPQWRPSYGGREHLSLQSVEFVSDQ